ncbi:hypothetical protein AVEN_252409-1 [Araneus ventricosus]|uniref:Transposase Tc1-like domain-containing protein n=1 Tax=Araneus ventricosus TaxID=182803 RepID=A0A4Y2AQU1_ARAVE|nr:hypothetical protein AVEN_252409-1 [Araneus ventricosus]
MGMGLSQADVARRFHSVVHRLSSQFQQENSVTRRRVSDRPRITTPSDDHYLLLSTRSRRNSTVRYLASDHFSAERGRISPATVRRRLHNEGKYARVPFVCVPHIRAIGVCLIMLDQRARYLDKRTVEVSTRYSQV